ncbi:hypothetical protein ACHAXR_006315 [Thalassiosira sp. AJA248-18]
MPNHYPRPSTSRTPTTLRPLSAELSSLSRSDGSASLQVGNTHVLCAVHGPMSPRISRWEKYDKGVVSVAFSRGLMANNTTSSGGGGGGSERELEYFLRDALSSCILLERYPRCVIQVVVQIVQADGSVLGTAVNCAVMALMDAGVAMGGLPVASTCVVVGGAGGWNGGMGGGGDDDDDDDDDSSSKAATIWLDPTAEEESGDGHAIVVLVTDASSSSTTASTTTTTSNTTISNQKNDGASSSNNCDIITSFTFGAPLSLQGLLSSVKSAKSSSAAMVAFMRLAVEQKVQREVQTLWS